RKAPRHILHAAPLSMHVLTLDLKRPPALFAVQSDGENGSVWKKIGSIASPVKRNAHLVTQPGTIGPTGRHGLAALDVIGERAARHEHGAGPQFEPIGDVVLHPGLLQRNFRMIGRFNGLLEPYAR